MKKTLHKLLCGLLAALTLTSVSLASQIEVVSSLSTVGSVSSAVNAVREQLESIKVSGMLDTPEGSRVATKSAELAIYSAATAEVNEETLLLDNETAYALPESNTPTASPEGEDSVLSTSPDTPAATLAELAEKAMEARESIMDEIKIYGAEILYDLPVGVRFLTPAKLSVTIAPDIDAPISLVVLDSVYYQLKIDLSGALASMSEPLTINLRDVDEENAEVEVTLSDDAFARYLTLCFQSDNPDMTNTAFVTERPDGTLIFNRYRYNDVTGQIEGQFDESGICAAPPDGQNYPPEFNDMYGSGVTEAIRKAVRKAQLQGAVAGYPDGSFRPLDGVTRRAFAKMLMELLNETDRSLKISMTDVKPNDSFYAYVATVVRKGYMKGYTDTFFGAADPLTRQQECAVIARILDKRGLLKTLTEEEIAKQIKKYNDGNQITIKETRACIAYLTANNAIAPDAKGNFNPTHNMNRGETMELLSASLLTIPF